MAANEGNREQRRREAEILTEFAEYGRGVRHENIQSKTKELTGTLPYAISLRPAVIAVVNSEEDVVAERQVRSVSVVRFTWLNQTDDHLVYTIGEASNSNSLKCIFGTVTNYTCDRARTGCSFTLTPEEENRLCRLADRQDIRNDNSNYIHHDRQV